MSTHVTTISLARITVIITVKNREVVTYVALNKFILINYVKKSTDGNYVVKRENVFTFKP